MVDDAVDGTSLCGSDHPDVTNRRSPSSSHDLNSRSGSISPPRRLFDEERGRDITGGGAGRATLAERMGRATLGGRVLPPPVPVHVRSGGGELGALGRESRSIPSDEDRPSSEALRSSRMIRRTRGGRLASVWGNATGSLPPNGADAPARAMAS